MSHRVAPRAEADLDDFWVYVAKDSGSMDVATRLIDSITERFWLLVCFPHAGRVRDRDLDLGCGAFQWANT